MPRDARGLSRWIVVGAIMAIAVAMPLPAAHADGEIDGGLRDATADVTEAIETAFDSASEATSGVISDVVDEPGDEDTASTPSDGVAEANSTIEATSGATSGAKDSASKVTASLSGSGSGVVDLTTTVSDTIRPDQGGTIVKGGASAVSTAAPVLTGATSTATAVSSTVHDTVSGAAALPSVTSGVSDVASVSDGVRDTTSAVTGAVRDTTSAVTGATSAAIGAWSPDGLVARRERTASWVPVVLSARGQIAQPVDGNGCPVPDDVICAMTVGVSDPGSLADVATAVIRYLAITGFGAMLPMMVGLALLAAGASAVVGARRRTMDSVPGPSAALVREETLRPKDVWAYP